MKKFTLAAAIIFLAGYTFAQNWVARGSAPDSYEMGGDPFVAHGSDGGGFIKSLQPEIDGFGTWMTEMDAEPYLGKGIKVSAYVKTEDAINVGIWVRVDGEETGLSFDNMVYRPLTGSNDWNSYEVILDVPENSQTFSLGLRLSGTGEAWFEGLEVEPASRTWVTQYKEESNAVFTVYALDEQMVWAAGTNGTFLRTIDGGSSWNQAIVPGAENIHFLSIAPLSADVTYLAGSSFGMSDTRIYKTTDGGENWEMQYQNTGQGAFINSMAFWDESNGIAVSDPVAGSHVIVTTSDGGANWNQISADKIPAPLPGEWAGIGDGGGTSLAVEGSSNAWFGTAYGQSSSDPVRIFKSDDKGQTWTVSDTDFPNDGEFQGIRTIVFADEMTGFAGGSAYPYSLENSRLLKTTDGGQTWDLVPEFPPIDPSTIAIIPNSGMQELIVTSEQGTAYSDDGGNNWMMLNTEASWSLSSVGSGSVWATGAWGTGGRIMHMNEIQETTYAEARLVEAEGAQLLQNYPNPFHQSTLISYAIPEPGDVRLIIYDLTGREVITLVNERRNAGRHSVTFYPSNLESGIYVYELNTGNYSQSRKMIVSRN